MKQCASCGTYSQDSYAMCAQCGAALPSGGGVYGRGFLSLLGSRLGIRLVIAMVGVIIFAGWFVYYGITH